MVGTVIAATLGVGYAASGSPDFAVEVHRAPATVYEAFAAINPSDTPFHTAGMPTQHIVVSRVSGQSVIFSADTANAGQPLRIALSFAPGSGPATTRVTAAIDVPPVPMNIDGTDKVLSEDKVEAKVREAIGAMAKRIDDGNSTTEAGYKFATLLELVAVASHPQKLKAAVERGEAVAAKEKTFRERYEKDGWKFNSDGTATQSAPAEEEYGYQNFDGQ